MSYGPFHTLRCKDDIAASLLGEESEERRPTSALEVDDDSERSTGSRATDGDATPLFLSDDVESHDARVLTGLASDDG